MVMTLFPYLENYRKSLFYTLKTERTARDRVIFEAKNIGRLPIRAIREKRTKHTTQVFLYRRRRRRRELPRLSSTRSAIPSHESNPVHGQQFTGSPMPVVCRVSLACVVLLVLWFVVLLVLIIGGVTSVYMRLKAL